MVVGWLSAFMGAGVVQASSAPPPKEPALVWRVPGEGRGTPAVVGDRAFFLSKYHELTAVDVVTGKVRWRRPTGGPGETTAGAAVVAVGNLVVAGDGGLVAFTWHGRERWRFRPRDDGMVGVYLGESSEERVFTGSATGRVWAVDAVTGTPVWTARVTGERDATVFAPIVAGRHVVAAFTSFGEVPVGGLAAVEMASGRVEWSVTLPEGRAGLGRAFAGGPVAAGGRVIVATQDGALHAFRIGSGRLAWTIPPPVAPPLAGDYEYRALVRAGGTLVAASLGGLITAYDLATRQERWRRHPVDASVVFGLATDGRVVYVPYLSGRLVALNLTDGGERWRTADPASTFSWKPLVAANHVFAVSSTAGLFAFRP